MERINVFMEEIKPLVHEVAMLDTKDIPFSEEVVAACARNACGCYGKTWQCPPGVGTLTERMRICRAYEHAIVFTTRHDLEDSFDFEGMVEGQKDFKVTVDRFAQLLGDSLSSYLLYSNEGCDRCATCTYPDAPCRFPHMLRPSLEASGLVVGDLANAAGIPYNNGPATVTYFGAIAFTI